MAKTRTRSKRKWPEHLAARVRALRQRLSGEGLDGLLITHPPDIRYLTDFAGDDSWLLVTARQAYVLTDFRFGEALEQSSPFVTAVMRKGRMTDALQDLLSDLKVAKIGFQADHLTVIQHRTLREAVEGVSFEPTEAWLLEQRAVKDEHELRNIRRALAVQEQALMQTLDQIRPGMSEQELVALVNYNMRWIGGEGESFPTIVAIDANSSLPHHVAGRTRVKAGATILIDCGAKADGYCSDLTRVVSMGGFPPRLTEVYNLVREAQLAAIDAIAPGKTLKEIDEVARSIIREAGYGDQFGHGLGHGIGLEIHEKPTLSPRAEGVLEPGNVVTVEPGVYLPGVGGVRIEDDVLVTEKGHRKLSTLPTAIESAII
jgi:Xaa-Pro aminopeptidase